MYGLKTVSLRLTTTYGPRMRVKDARQTFLGWWFRQLVEEQTLSIYGDGQQFRDFNFVDDVVMALLLAASDQEAAGKIYNLGAPETIDLLDLAELLIEINGRGSYEIIPFPENRRRIDIGDYQGDFGKIRRELGWEPCVALHDGLADSLAYYEKHLRHYI